MKLSFYNSKGFTLIEVMVASMVLFSVVAAASLGIKTAFEASSKVTSSAYMAESLQDVVQNVKTELFKGKVNGNGTLDKILSFSFNAEQIDSGKNIVSGSNFMSGEISHGKFFLTLYSVDLLLKADMQGRINKRKYSYKELVWIKKRF